jgi:DNA-binding response OmpR family regulator
MGKARLLIVEDDIDICNMLRIFFTKQNYDVDTALRASDALDKTRSNLPHLIILDIILPDTDGFELCRILRTNTRTSHVPIIFLTQKDDRADRLQGLELGADDYITKPFDIEELRLRVHRAITRAEQQSLTDPRTGLPSGRLIEEQLRRIIRLNDWSFMDIRIKHFDAFMEVYGFVAGDDVLRFTALLIGEVVDEIGTANDFIGHAGGDNFTIFTSSTAGPLIYKRIQSRFATEVLSHYNYIDRKQGFIVSKGQAGKEIKAPLMSLSIGEVSSSSYAFTDIREITEQAADARRKND